MRTFEELGISQNIIKAIEELGFEKPMPVQEEVISLLLEKNTDIIALAQTGTGKTAAFGLPIIQQIDLDVNKPQALIICPTRELCLQISSDLCDFSKYTDGLRILAVYGGSSIETQIKALHRGVHIIVATPGRLIDLINRKAVKLYEVTKVVMDEADEMLNMGFLDDIDEILSHLPEDRNTLLFSATMPTEIAAIAKKYMKTPAEITIGTKNSSSENVKHICYTVHARDKYLTLKRLADFYPNIYGIVFCRTRRETQEVADKLMADGYNAEALHGDLSQAQRDSVMQKFRIKNIQLLVATDVAARGIDVNDLTHVINYNLPDDMDAYNHRSGRTGRAGKSGVSIAIINLKEKGFIRQIERKINKQFVHAKVPSGEEICAKQLFHFIEKIEKIEVNDAVDPYLSVVFRKLEWIDKEELIRRLVSVEFNQFVEYYKNAKDLNQTEDFRDKGVRSDRGGKERFDRGRERFDRGGERGDRGDRGRDRNERGDRGDRPSYASDRNGGDRKGFTKLYINLGRIDGIYPNQIIDIVRKTTKSDRVNLGKIDIYKKFSVFEIESKEASNALDSFKNINIDGRKVFVKLDEQSWFIKRWFINISSADKLWKYCESIFYVCIFEKFAWGLEISTEKQCD